MPIPPITDDAIALIRASHGEYRVYNGAGTDFLVRLADLTSAALSKVRYSRPCCLP